MLRPIQTITARQFFALVAPRAIAQHAPVSGVGRVEFRIDENSHRDGGTWVIDFDRGTVSLVDARIAAKEKPHVILCARARDFMAVVNGTMSFGDGILTKRLNLAGDAARIQALTQVFSDGKQIFSEIEGEHA